MAFTSVVKILRLEDTFVNIYGKDYMKVFVNAAGIELYALICTQEDLVRVDDYVCCKDTELTTLTGRDVVFIMHEFEKISEKEFNLVPQCEVQCEGKLVKTEKAYLRKVGADQKSFLPCSLMIKTHELGRYFKIFLVSFCKKAEKLNELESDTYISVRCRLKVRKDGQGLEFNVSSFELLDKDLE